MENQTDFNLSLADLTALRNVVDLACSRGAFRGNEMKAVGEVFERLDAFLTAVIAQAEAVKAEQPADTDAAPAPEQSAPTGE